ncbi:MAG: carboxypeptidase regulatory-like domain-containing protein [Burkholderiales bacterium]|nr:carboxypeptidase regulatory-like domain-containing protein [Bacteroidia bacterium]
MSKKNLHILFGIVLILNIISCKKTPGEGGNATIKGAFWDRNHDQFFTYVTGRYPAVNATVYLFFGEDSSPGTSVKTNSNGEFEFKYLRKGKYRVVAYSKQIQSTSSTPKEFPVETILNISKRKEVKDIGLDTLDQ